MPAKREGMWALVSEGVPFAHLQDVKAGQDWGGAGEAKVLKGHYAFGNSEKLAILGALKSPCTPGTEPPAPVRNYGPQQGICRRNSQRFLATENAGLANRWRAPCQ